MDRKLLVDSLGMAKAALSSWDHTPILTYFCFTKDSVHAYNDDMAIECGLDSELECALPGALLYSLLSKLEGEAVTFDVKKGKVTMKCGKNKTVLPSLPNDMYSYEPPEEKSEIASFKVTPGFIVGLGRCLMGTGQDAQVKEEIGVSFIAKDKTQALYSTDNISVSKQELNLPSYKSDEKELSIIMPAHFCKNLISLVGAIGGEEVFVEVGDGWIFANIGGEVNLFSRLISDAKKYDFEDVIDELTGGKTEKGVELPHEVFTALDRAIVLLSNSTDKTVTFDLDDEKLKLTVKSEMGIADDDITIDGCDFGTFEFNVNPELLMRANQYCSRYAFGDKVVICTEGSFLHIVAHNVGED